VQQWDLRKDLPFASDSFDVVYHSHVLEHFSRPAALQLLGECRRVLRLHGVIRVAVPDLEQIARLYIEALDKSLAGDHAWQARYEWILLEMYDQTVRRSSGGEMLAHMRRDPVPERDFISSRVGAEFHRAQASPVKPQQSDGTRSLLRNFISRKLARIALGREGIQAYDAGLFRESGEVHLWMYDRYSLAKLLESAGFSGAEAVSATASRIHDWEKYHLDTEPDGSVYKPDSLYMEAVRA
jgi:SAM-dependent methyltransferase